MKRILVFFSLCLFLSFNPVNAEVVKEIKVVGNGRIHPDMIKNFLSFKEGDEIDDNVLNKSVRTLYKSGFFDDVKIEEDNGTLLITVSENPVIDKIAFEGNSEIKEEDIKKEMATRERGIFSPSSIKKDAENIKTMYKRLGFFKASVDAKVIKKPDNKYDVVFEVVEGEK